MSFKSRTENGVRVFVLGGEIREYDGAPYLHDRVEDIAKEAGSKGYKNLVLDLSSVSHVDSAGFGELLSIFSRCKMAGGKAKIVRPNDKIRRLLKATKMDDYYEIFDSLDEALASFGVSSKIPESGLSLLENIVLMIEFFTAEFFRAEELLNEPKLNELARYKQAMFDNPRYLQVIESFSQVITLSRCDLAEDDCQKIKDRLQKCLNVFEDHEWFETSQLDYLKSAIDSL